MWEPDTLCSSSVTLGPAHLTSNTWKQISQPPPPGMASHPVAHHLFLSGCDATLTATLASWCLRSLTFFPLPLLSPYGLFFSETSFLGNSGYHNNLTHSVPVSLESCAPLPDDLLAQHQLSILGMTPLAASFGRCLLTLGPESVWDHCTIGGTARWGDGGTPQSRRGPLVVRSRAQALNLKPFKYPTA